MGPSSIQNSSNPAVSVLLKEVEALDKKELNEFINLFLSMHTGHIELTEAASKAFLKLMPSFDYNSLQEIADQAFLAIAKRRAPSLSKQETELMAIINTALPSAEWAKVQELYGKTEAGTISKAELKEYGLLTDKMEEIAANRLYAIAELAKIKHMTAKELMNKLGLIKPNNVI